MINTLSLIRKDIPSLSIDDSVSRAINLMDIHSIKQVPVFDLNKKFYGMLYYKDLINTHYQPSSKIKNFISNDAHILKPDDDLKVCINYIISTGKTGLPVVNNNEFVGLIVDKDLISNIELGNMKVNDIMSSPILIDENSDLDNALSLMRKDNVSRLPVVNNKNIVVGIISLLDILKIIATPNEKDSHSNRPIEKSKPGSALVKDIKRNALTIESGSIVKTIVDNFKNNDELVIISDNKPVGIITSKDILEHAVLEKTDFLINTANFDDENIRNEIIQQMEKFIKKIEGRLDNILSVMITFERHKTLCSIRTRIISKNQTINTHAEDYDPLVAFGAVLEKLERQITESHSKIVDNKFKEKLNSADEEI